MNLKQEQILLIFTTVISLLTSWTWNNFFSTYINVYFGTSLSTTFLVAVFTTLALFAYIQWIFRHLTMNDKNDNKDT